MSTRLYTLFRPIQASGRVRAYRYEERPPSMLLAPYVCCYWLTEPAAGGDGEHFPPAGPFEAEAVDRVLPDGCTDILFVHDLKRNRRRVMYSGLFDESFTVTYDREHPVRKFGVRFFPGGVRTWMGMPLFELANAHCDADAVWTGLAGDMNDRMFGEESFEGKARAMDQYLISCMKADRTASDNLVDNLLYRIFMTGGQTTVQELGRREAVSPRHMNRIFRQKIGTSPKTFCEVVRFQKVVNEVGKAGRIDGAALAAGHGYFDQAHLIRDFRRFYGDSPQTALKEFRAAVMPYNP